MSDKQKYKLGDCSLEAGGCRCVTAVRNTQPASLKVLKYNQVSPKAIKPSLLSPHCQSLLKLLLFVPVVFKAALHCPVIMDSPGARPCRGFQLPAFPDQFCPCLWPPCFKVNGFWAGREAQRANHALHLPSCPPAPQWVLCQLLFPSFWPVMPSTALTKP